MVRNNDLINPFNGKKNNNELTNNNKNNIHYTNFFIRKLITTNPYVHRMAKHKYIVYQVKH